MRDIEDLAARGDYDAAFVFADGLSALAVQRHACRCLENCCRSLTREHGSSRRFGGVAGTRGHWRRNRRTLGARSVVVLIGERPGLELARQPGIYLTWDPRPGRTDAERNCISNVRAEGLGYGAAARLTHLLTEWFSNTSIIL